MLRNAFSVLLLFAASGFDSSPGSQPQPVPDSLGAAFDPNANPEQQPDTAASGFPTSTSTGKGEKSYQEAIGQQEEPQAGNQEGPASGTEPHPQDDVASTELPQTPFDPEAPLGRTAEGVPIQPD